MEKNKPSIFNNVQLRSEDSWPKHYFTPDAGKKKPWNVLAYRAAKKRVREFMLDVKAAIKEILKEVK